MRINRLYSPLLCWLTMGLLMDFAYQDISYSQDNKQEPSSSQVANPTTDIDHNPGNGIAHSDQIETITFDAFNEYRRISSDIASLADEGRQHGFNATPEEYDVQEKAFKVLFPGMPASEHMLENEIIAKKYCRTISAIDVSKAELQTAYARLQPKNGNGNFPSFDTLMPILEVRSLLEKREIQDKIKLNNDESEKRMNRALIHSWETWSASDLSVQAGENECIAEHPDSSQCILLVKKYNEHIKYVSIPKSFPIDSAKIRAVKSILTDCYIANEARARGEAETERMKRQKEGWLRFAADKLKYKRIGMPVTDNNELLRAYSLYYDALFRRRDFPFYSIIGSNDSLYIDSISKVCKRFTLADSQKCNDRSKTIPLTPPIPWSYSKFELLPDEFYRVLDTMSSGRISPVIRTPYGFFIVRLDSMQTRWETSFQDAKDNVILLATKLKRQNLDSALLARAFSIYKSNKRLNTVRDTLKVKVFLVPTYKIYSNQIEGSKSVIKANKLIGADTSGWGIGILSTKLPFDVRDSLLNRMESIKVTETIIGPITSRYGVWHFQVLARKQGGATVSFATVKKQLVDSLVIHELEAPADFPWENPDSTLQNIALAKAYEPWFWGDNQVLNAKAGISRDQGIKQWEKRREEIDTWFSKISIHFPAAYRQVNGYR
jgi:hypothetical protein